MQYENEKMSSENKGDENYMLGVLPNIPKKPYSPIRSRQYLSSMVPVEEDTQSIDTLVLMPNKDGTGPKGKGNQDGSGGGSGNQGQGQGKNKNNGGNGQKTGGKKGDC